MLKEREVVSWNNVYSPRFKVPCTVYESIKDYTAPEVLDGDNKYQAGTHGMQVLSYYNLKGVMTMSHFLQKAVRKVSFTKFPPILHLQLMRFQYDMYSEGHTKLNDRLVILISL